MLSRSFQQASWFSSSSLHACHSERREVVQVCCQMGTLMSPPYCQQRASAALAWGSSSSSNFQESVHSQLSFNRRKKGGIRSVAVVRAGGKRVRFSSTLQTDIPFQENKEVPFELYMMQRPRIFQAIFPDRQRAERLSDEVWRIVMLPLGFFFLEGKPEVDMRIWLHDVVKSGPVPGSDPRAKQLLRLDIVRCELKGLGYLLNPSDFKLGADGALYPARLPNGTRLRGSMHLSVDLHVPAALSLTPTSVIEGTGNALLKQLLYSMKDKVNRLLLDDYSRFVRQNLLDTRQRADQERVKPSTS